MRSNKPKHTPLLLEVEILIITMIGRTKKSTEKILILVNPKRIKIKKADLNRFM